MTAPKNDAPRYDVPRYDVLGIGNAIVDVLARPTRPSSSAKGLPRAPCSSSTRPRAEELYGIMGPATDRLGRLGRQHGGGRRAPSAARAGFIGKVKTTSPARSSPTTSRRSASHFDDAGAEDGPATARSFILVTPDGERTMNTYLGACQNLTPDDVDEARWRGRRSSISKAISGIRRPPRRPSARRSRSPTRPATRSRSRSPTPSASTATATSSWAACATAASTSCSPTSRAAEPLRDRRHRDRAGRGRRMTQARRRHPLGATAR